MDDATYGLGHSPAEITARRAQRPTTPRFLPTAGEAASDDPISLPGGPSSAPSKLRFTERVPLRTEARGVSLLPAIRRIVSAIRLWRAQARSRQELCELSDHELSDIGLRRVDVGYGFPAEFWYRD